MLVFDSITLELKFQKNMNCNEIKFIRVRTYTCVIKFDGPFCAFRGKLDFAQKAQNIIFPLIIDFSPLDLDFQVILRNFSIAKFDCYEKWSGVTLIFMNGFSGKGGKLMVVSKKNLSNYE